MLLPFSWSVFVCFLVPQKKLMILLTEIESLANARFRGANAEIRSGQRDLKIVKIQATRGKGNYLLSLGIVSFRSFL